MSQIAIVATPPPTSPTPETNAPATPAADRFDDRLRQARPGTKAPRNAASGAAPDETTGNKRPEGKDPATHSGDGHPPGDDQDGTGVDAPTALAAAIAISPAPLRQAVAARGKALPETAGIQAGKSAGRSATEPGLSGAIGSGNPKDGPVPADLTMAKLVTPPGQAPGTAPTGRDMAGPHADRLPEVLHHAARDDFAAQIAHLAGAQPAASSAPTSAPVQLAMQATPGQPQFAQEAAQHVSWLVGNHVQRAEIQLNPAKLGPIQVEISAHHDRVDVSFAVQHPQTVNALQQTLPQLQHMLAQQGLNLGQASVGHQAPGQQHAAFAHATNSRTQGATEIDAPGLPTSMLLRTALPGRVDDFA